ncbi:MAG: 1-acyl-sn-glycerol-3-phosphate acyltransferase [Bacteroidia bacterium]|nr:1-acyl-sn-glycerol-3-phosphate acyltransferase [Bacteroidia bacterium]
MQVIRAIFSPIYSVWAVSWFLVFLLTVLPAALILKLFFPRTADRRFFRYGAFWAAFWMFICGVRYRMHNRDEYYRKDTTYVVCSNHVSLLDVFCSTIPLRAPVRVLAKKEIKRIPLLGTAFAMVSVFVDRASAESRRRSFEKLGQDLRSGTHSIFMYPEGTRNKSRTPVKEFYDGAFRLAVQAGVPLCVFVAVHPRTVFDPKGIFFKPFGKIDIYFLPPYPTEGLTEADVPALRDRIRRDMWNLLAEKDPYFAGVEKME